MYELHGNREIGPMDQMFKPYFWCYLLCFPLSFDNTAPTRVLLQKALEALIAEAPYLAGSVRRVPESDIGSYHIHFVSSSAPSEPEVVFKDLTDPKSGWTDSYEQLKAINMPIHKLDSRILAPLTAGVEQTRNVMAIQANFIPGGLILAMCFHHNFVDGGGAARIIARFSEHCAGTAKPVDSKTAAESTPDVLRYQHVQAAHKFDSLKDNPDLWRLNCLEWNEPLTGQEGSEWPEVIPILPPPSDAPLTSTLWTVSASALQELKAAAQPVDGSSWVSSNDSLVAFLWRHIIRARYQLDDPETSFSTQGDRESSAIIALDGRKDLGVPPSYTGNCVFHSYTSGMTIEKVGNPETQLSELAVAVRRAVTRARDPELLKRVVGLAATIPDVSRIRFGNDNLGTDVYVTSWMALPFYRLEWGPVIGKVEFLRVPDGHFETLCCVLPARDGVVEVVTSMRVVDDARLRSDGDFTRNAKPV